MQLAMTSGMWAALVASAGAVGSWMPMPFVFRVTCASRLGWRQRQAASFAAGVWRSEVLRTVSVLLTETGAPASMYPLGRTRSW